MEHQQATHPVTIAQHLVRAVNVGTVGQASGFEAPDSAGNGNVAATGLHRPMLVLRVRYLC